MRAIRWSKVVAFASVFALSAASLAGAFWTWRAEPPTPYQDGPATSSSTVDAATGEPYYQFNVYVDSMNAEGQSVTFLVEPREWLATAQGTEATADEISAWVSTVPVRFTFDGTVEEGPAADATGAIQPGTHAPFKVTARSFAGAPEWSYDWLSRYPFDSYPFMFRTTAHYLPAGADGSTDADWQPLDLRATFIGSRDAEFTGSILDYWTEPDGLAFGISIVRPWSQRIYAVLVMLVIVVMVALIVFMTWRIVSARPGASRPPVMQGLIWAAALTFTTVQIRENYPGDPPIGVAADYLIIVPALIASIAVAAVLLHQWSHRDDFDTAGIAPHEHRT